MVEWDVSNGSERPFARLRLGGARFQAVGMPVAALPELVAYQELVTEVAKGLFFQHHPERRRVPKGFEERLGLRLTDVQPGSAVPVLVRTNIDPDPSLFTYPSLDDEYDRARDLIAQMPHAAQEREDLPEGFPDVSGRVLARLGQTLRGDESIEFGSASSDLWSPPYTPQLRRRLLLHRQSSYTASATLVGVLAEMNFESGQFALRTDEGHLVDLPYDESSFRVLERTVQPSPDKHVLVEGTVQYDRYERPQRVDPVDSITIAEDAAVQQAYDAARATLAERASLARGWLGNGEGESITIRAQNAAASLLEALEDAGDPTPRVYPTPEGGVSLEWTLTAKHIVAEISPEGSLWLHQTDTTADRYDEEEIPAENGGAIAATWLHRQLSAA